MRIVWVTNMANPDPRSGGGLRSLRLVQALSSTWPVDVVHVGEGLDEAAYAAASGAASVRSIRPDERGKVATLLLTMRHRWPVPVSRSHSTQVARLLEVATASNHLPVVENGWLLGHLPAKGRRMVVLSDVPSDLTQHLPVAGARKVERWWNVRAYRAIERRLVAADDVAVVVVSERDKTLMGARAAVVGNGADLPASVTAVPAVGQVLFIGSMGYPPNAEAVRWWVEQVWPGSDLPPLTVIGESSDAELDGLASHPAIELVGEVPDVGPWLAGARAIAIPLLSGSGSRLKLVEALAQGRPVVATSKGAEGFHVTTGDQLLVADSPAEFAAAVHRVLQDVVLAAGLAARGRAFAQGLSWQRIGAELVEVVTELTSRPLGAGAAPGPGRS